MVKRKSPIRHKVRSYIRKGKRVRSYVRGKGSKTKTSAKKKIGKTLVRPKAFTVNFKYSNRKGDGESVIVIARNYNEALKEGFEEKVDTRKPIEVEVIDPTLGQALRFIGGKLKSASKLSAKYSVKGLKFIGKQTKIHARDYMIKHYIRNAYSPDRTVRTFARYKLRHDYPEVWNVMDISRR